MTIDTLPDTWPVSHHMATLRRYLPDLSRQYNIKALGIFGSYIHNAQTPQSDLDVLVEFNDLSQHSLFTVVRIQDMLSDMLGVQLDSLPSSLFEVIFHDILPQMHQRWMDHTRPLTDELAWA